MTNLTEQWKKGELPSGWYYVKVISDFEYPDDIAFYTGGYFELYSDEDIEEVLAPLPDYTEWCAKLEKNAQLKELLKECKDEIEYLRKHYKGNIDHLKNNTRLDKEINQALGEDK